MCRCSIAGDRREETTYCRAFHREGISGGDVHVAFLRATAVVDQQEHPRSVRRPGERGCFSDRLIHARIGAPTLGAGDEIVLPDLTAVPRSVEGHRDDGFVVAHHAHVVWALVEVAADVQAYRVRAPGREVHDGEVHAASE